MRENLVHTSERLDLDFNMLTFDWDMIIWYILVTWLDHDLCINSSFVNLSLYGYVMLVFEIDWEDWIFRNSEMFMDIILLNPHEIITHPLWILRGLNNYVSS